MHACRHVMKRSDWSGRQALQHTPELQAPGRPTRKWREPGCRAAAQVVEDLADAVGQVKALQEAVERAHDSRDGAPDKVDVPADVAALADWSPRDRRAGVPPARNWFCVASAGRVVPSGARAAPSGRTRRRLPEQLRRPALAPALFVTRRRAQAARPTGPPRRTTGGGRRSWATRRASSPGTTPARRPGPARPPARRRRRARCPATAAARWPRRRRASPSRRGPCPPPPRRAPCRGGGRRRRRPASTRRRRSPRRRACGDAGSCACLCGRERARAGVAAPVELFPAFVLATWVCALRRTWRACGRRRTPVPVTSAGIGDARDARGQSISDAALGAACGVVGSGLCMSLPCTG